MTREEGGEYGGRNQGGDDGRIQSGDGRSQRMTQSRRMKDNGGADGVRGHGRSLVERPGCTRETSNLGKRSWWRCRTIFSRISGDTG